MGYIFISLSIGINRSSATHNYPVWNYKNTLSHVQVMEVVVLLDLVVASLWDFQCLYLDLAYSHKERDINRSCCFMEIIVFKFHLKSN
jgi:hypothetical protein